MATDKVIGGPFSSQVINQLQIRSDKYSKEARDNRDLEYISSKTGWVKLSSGVDVQGSDGIAKDYILIGGTKGRFGDKTYSNYSDGLGFRPMPGITGVQIRSINRFGVLKEATVTFNCWDIKQLQELELIYMRPGFTALLEWGHSLYYTDASNFETTPKTVSSFFTKGTTKEDIYNEIEKLKTESNQNYDGILGFVKNFSWSYRSDGGYDCTTNLISIGEIIESLTIDGDVSAYTTNKKPKKTDEIDPPTMLENVLKTLKQYGVFEGWNKVKEYYKGFADKYTELSGFNEASIYKRTGIQTKDLIKSKTGSTGDFLYMSLQHYCALVNTLLIVDSNNKNLIKLNTKIAPLSTQPNPDKIPTCRFRNFKTQISSDPAVCLVATPSAVTWYEDENFTEGVSFLNNIRADQQGSSDEILNIAVNVDLIAKTIANLTNRPKNERTLNNLFQPLFTAINEALGGVTDLNFYYDESTYTYYIVDRQVQVEDSDVSTLNITGLKSTVTQFNFTTKLSPAITTMVAVSAQAGAADVGLEAEALLRWNEGLSDRILGSKQTSDKTKQDNDKITKEREESQTERQKVVTKALKSFWTKRQYNKEEFETARLNYNYYATTYVQFYDDEGENSSQKAGPAGIIPFEVAITMDGISGIKIGQAFKINTGIMPDKYNGVVGFIVTGIDHDIQNNRWSTNIKAQTIILKNKVKGSGPIRSTRTERRGLRPVTNFRADDNQAKKVAEQYLGRTLTNTEWSELVSATFAEAGTNSKERAYVMGVILNRTRDANKTITDILAQPNQFQAVTGTTADGNATSTNYTNGPDKASKENIYKATTDNLLKVPKTYKFFTSANLSAYKAGTDLSFIQKLKDRGGIQIGQTIFSS